MDFEADTVQARARNGAPIAGPSGRSAASVYAPAYGATTASGFNCGPDGCVAATSGTGTYSTQADCAKDCRFICQGSGVNKGCVQDPTGNYTSFNKCVQDCIQPQVSYQCEGGLGCVLQQAPVDISKGLYASQGECQKQTNCTGGESYQCEGGFGCVVKQAPPDPTKGLYASQAECERKTQCTGGAVPQSISWCVVLLVIILLVGASSLVFF